MSKPDWQIDVVRRPIRRSIDFYLWRFTSRERSATEVVSGLVTEPEPALLADSVAGPAFSLAHEQAQRLMDDLWRAGVRPSDEGTVGQLEAMRAHIKDLQKIVFDTPKTFVVRDAAQIQWGSDKGAIKP